MNFVFYDTETTGVDAAFDQILQFAAILTDEDLNEIDRFEIRCRLLPHIVPAPMALIVTGVSVSQLLDDDSPTHYEMIQQIRTKLLSWSPAIFVGYNSLSFDEQLLRQALYQTLHPPYLTSQGGNLRADVMKLVQTANVFAPTLFNVPNGDNGKPTIRLDKFAPANGFDHSNAHDALADVEATIFVANCVRNQEPAIWNNFLRFSDKTKVSEFVFGEENLIFSLTDAFFGRPYSWLVTPLGVNPKNNSEIIVFDLVNDPKELLSLSDNKLSTLLAKSPKPLRRLKTNAAPIIFEHDEAPGIASSKSISQDELVSRAQYLKQSEVGSQRLIDLLIEIMPDYELSEHVEEQMYDSFSSWDDQSLMEKFHTLPWNERNEFLEQFEDERLKTLGRRLIYFEHPGLLEKQVGAKIEDEVIRRVVNPDGDVPWLTIGKAISDLDDLLSNGKIADLTAAQEIRDYLQTRNSDLGAA